MPHHERVVPIPGLRSFRDLGGYRTSDGAFVVKYKHIYRADDVSMATPEGQKILLEKLHIKSIIDFRGTHEKESAPYTWSPEMYFPIPIEAVTIMREIRSRSELDGPTAEALLRSMATTFLIDFKEAYRRFFEVLLYEVKGKPAVFHCTAGKDRTGIAAALLLTALDVPPATVTEDFLLTNQFCKLLECGSIKKGDCVLSQEAVNVLLRAQPYFLDLSFEEVRKRYGTMQAYMQKELGLGTQELEKLREYYLRPCSHPQE